MLGVPLPAQAWPDAWRAAAWHPPPCMAWSVCASDASLRMPSARFKRSECEGILQEVLNEKLAFTNERDKKGRLSYIFTQDEASEVIAEIVQESQSKIIGAWRLARRRCVAWQAGACVSHTVPRHRGCSRCRAMASMRLPLADARLPPRSLAPTAKMTENNNGNPPRYKLIVQATFGENMGHMVRSASRCLWDASTDNSASAHFMNGRVYAVAMCFALYFE